MLTIMLSACRDTIKLTALFTARRGRAFLYALAQCEARSIEFKLIRPASQLFGYFNALVEQYSEVLLPPSIRSGYFEQTMEFDGPKSTLNFVILTADVDPHGDKAAAFCVAAKL